MDNHYHLLVETPQTNLSQAMQWLGVSYTMWFNRRHGLADRGLVYLFSI
jgi:REP element-mobilizing transposase RayT